MPPSNKKIDAADQKKVRRVTASISDTQKRVHCDIHGPQRGYVICMCCLQFRTPVAHVEPPATGKLGEILCKRKGKHETFELRLVCHKCAEAASLLKATEV